MNLASSPFFDTFSFRNRTLVYDLGPALRPYEGKESRRSVCVCVTEVISLTTPLMDDDPNTASSALHSELFVKKHISDNDNLFIGLAHRSFTSSLDTLF